MIKKETHNKILAVFLFLFLIFVVVTTYRFSELLETNDELLDAIENQRMSYTDTNSQLNLSYSELQYEYGRLLTENSALKTQIDGGTVMPEYQYTEDEIYLLAQCVEAEAGFYEDYEISQRYVTQVILNRLHSSKFPNSIEEVIYQQLNGIPQFCVAYNGRIDREVEPETLINVYSVIVNGTDLPEYVCYFYADYVEDNWVNNLNIYTSVGGTVFAYADKEDY